MSDYKTIAESKNFIVLDKLDLTRFNRHLIRSKLKRRKSDEESQLHSRIQG